MRGAPHVPNSPTAFVRCEYSGRSEAKMNSAGQKIRLAKIPAAATRCSRKMRPLYRFGKLVNLVKYPLFPALIKEPLMHRREQSELLADRLVMAAIRLTRTLRAQARSGRFSGPQISALAVIVYSKRISARDLAALEEVSAAAISKLIKAMEAEGLVRRTPDRTDARLQWISATAKGTRLVREGHAHRIAPLAAAIAALPDGRRAAVDRACAIVEEMTKAARGD